MKNLTQVVFALSCLFAVSLGAQATGVMFSKVEKFVTYNHPDQRTCMIQFYMLYNPTLASNTLPTTTDNGTVGLSIHFEVKGKEDLIQCTSFYSQTSWNAQGCSIGNIEGKGLRDFWDVSSVTT